MTAATSSSSNSNTATTNNSNNNTSSLLHIILDVSPLAWGERDLKRSAQDKARAVAGKRSVGPAVWDDVVLQATVALCNAVLCLEKDAAVIVSAVADNETAIVYPRKDQLTEWLDVNPESFVPETSCIREHIGTGVAELMERAAKQAAAIAEQNASVNTAAATTTTSNDNSNSSGSSSTCRQAAMAAAFSKALCLMNRFMVASRAQNAVSALQQQQLGSMDRTEDDGVLALIGSSGNSSKKKKKTNGGCAGGSTGASAWAPRIMMIQASEDRSTDYNAFMNCAFAAVKHRIVVDGCFLTSGTSGAAASSAFLEQACDLTGGVYLAPSGAAQVGGALTEVLFSVFLPPLSCRSSLNLPALNKVDFRARCFESGEIVDMAFVCNQCLSIFQKKPTGQCPTCQASIMGEKRLKT